MKIIWIRHGTVDRNSPAGDTLTASGKSLAKRLPKLLRENGLEPEIIFYDKSCKSCKIIERCEETISGFPNSVKKIPYNFKDGRSILKRLKRYKAIEQAAICYTSESLKYFPKIQGAICEKCMDNPKSKEKVPKIITDRLYQNIIVSKFENNEIKQVCKIKTGDSRTRS